MSDELKLKNEIIQLKVSRNAALSREQEANRNWSTAAKKWVNEKQQLKAEIKAVLAEIKDFWDKPYDGTTFNQFFEELQKRYEGEK